MKTTISSRLFDRARKVIPGGVNSPVRACKSVRRDPLFIAKAAGSKIYDADGGAYIDFVASWGPMILGHAHEAVVEAVRKAAEEGTSFGAPTEREVDMAELVIRMVPSMERVRMVNSGTEATMSALRLARGLTGRDVAVKFDGCYHGHADSFLVKAGSGLATLGIPGSPGVPADITRNTLSLPYNDLAAFAELMERAGDRVAAVIVEPVAGNMGVVPPEPGFLEGLREETRKRGALLIFDEVITGFRLAPGGAQERYGVTPDLTCLGKIIGGGLPVGAFGGKAEFMDRMAPDGDVYQAGTLSGNPLAMAGGLATLKILSEPGFHEELEKKSATFWQDVRSLVEKSGRPGVVNAVGSMGTLFFNSSPVRNFSDAMASDSERFIEVYGRMLEQGVYLAPSPFEATFVSAAHTREDLEKALAALEAALGGLR
jgi:glutamate-1-semialdehyde 2,1-aminomutase